MIIKLEGGPYDHHEAECVKQPASLPMTIAFDDAGRITVTGSSGSPPLASIEWVVRGPEVTREEREAAGPGIYERTERKTDGGVVIFAFQPDAIPLS